MFRAPVPSGPLTDDLLREVPQAAGVYCAWVTSEGVAELGIASSGRVLMYVGIGADLRSRLRQHLRHPWFDLAELLAATGLAVWPWWGRLLGKGPGYWNQLSPLAIAATEQQRGWQQKRLRWGWMACDRSAMRKNEAEIIRRDQPLLNRQGVQGGAPLATHPNIPHPVRWRWLWHMAWAARLYGAPLNQRNVRPEWPLWDHHADENGFPCAPVTPGSRPVDPEPFEAQLVREVMTKAAGRAAPGVAKALSQPISTGELELWWAAHAAASLVGDSAAEAVNSSLSQPGQEGLQVGPPSGEPISELARLERWLSRERH